MGSHDLTHHREYIKSRCWACDKSPIGAHHWIERCGIWICKYCFDVRKFAMTFRDAVDITQGKKPNLPTEKHDWPTLPPPRDKFQF